MLNKQKELWFDVAAARLETGGKAKRLEVRLEGERSDQKAWIAVSTVDAQTDYRSILDSLDKKRPVIAKLEWQQEAVQVTMLRFLSADTVR